MSSMARTKLASPTLTLNITEEAHERAKRESSAGCLIADAIKTQYPQFTNVAVDMATIRFSEPKNRMRYTYLTSPIAQHVLLSFDQGWPNPTDTVIVKEAVKVEPMKTSDGEKATKAVKTAERKAVREAQKAIEEKMVNNQNRLEAYAVEMIAQARLAEELASEENAPSSIAEAPASVETATSETEQETRAETEPSPVEPPTHSETVETQPVEAVEEAPVKRSHGNASVLRRTPPPITAQHPNLLGGRKRFFGAGRAIPGLSFSEAVETTIAKRLAERDPEPEEDEDARELVPAG